MGVIIIENRKKTVPVLYLDVDAATLGDGVPEAGVADLLAVYREHGWRIICFANRGGISLGEITMEDVMKEMTTFHRAVGPFDKIIWCQHHPEADGPEYAVCWCRLPRPGLIIEAAISLGEHTGEVYPPHLALLVGVDPVGPDVSEATGIRFMAAHAWLNGGHTPRAAS